MIRIDSSCMQHWSHILGITGSNFGDTQKTSHGINKQDKDTSHSWQCYNYISHCYRATGIVLQICSRNPSKRFMHCPLHWSSKRWPESPCHKKKTVEAMQCVPDTLSVQTSDLLCRHLLCHWNGLWCMPLKSFSKSRWEIKPTHQT